MGITVQRGEYSRRRAMAITTYLKLTFRVTQDYFTVFHALCPKIGLLGPLSGQVVLLYMGLVQDTCNFRS
jgi:hypothetical protein